MTELSPKNSPSDARLRLVTLGEPSLWLRAAEAPPRRIVGAGKSLALLVYLTGTRDRRARRVNLCELLWSQDEPEAAQRSLRNMTFQLRKRTECDDLFEPGGPKDPWLALRAAIETDCDAFHSAWACGNWEAAVHLYTGDFLDGLAVPGGSNFDDWAQIERVALRKRFAEAGENAVRARLSAGDARQALALAKRLRDEEPLDQRSWRRLLECCVMTGDPGACRLELHALARCLAEEGIEPDPATRAAMQAAEAVAEHRGSIAIPDERAATALPASELVGRDREFSVIVGGWQGVRKNKTKRFHLSSKPGLGKTRLLEELRRRFSGAGAHVVYIPARHGMRDIAYAFASEVAAVVSRLPGAQGVGEETAGTLIALNPSLEAEFPNAPRDDARGDEALRRRAHALRDLISAVAYDRPLALLLDDLQWADPVSFRAMNVSLAGIEREPLLVVTAARSSASTAELDESQRLLLEPLTADDVSALMGSIARHADNPVLAEVPLRLCAASDGSPLLVLAALRSFLDQGFLILEDGAWRVCDAAALRKALARADGVQQLIASVEGTERDILLAVALAGVPLRLHEIADAIRAALPDVDAGLARLEVRGFASRDADAISIAHEEYADAIRDTADPEACREMARALGNVFANTSVADLRRLCLAGSLLARGGEYAVPRLIGVFERFVREKRLDGDRSSDRALAREFLGQSATPEFEARLVRSLPLLVRARVVSRGQLVASVAVGIALFGGLATWYTVPRRETVPDAVLVARRLSADRKNLDIFQIPIDASRWAGVSIVDVRLTGRPWRHKMLAGNGGDDLRPDGRGWTGGVSLADSGVIDIFDYDLRGGARRLTFAKLDDLEPSWAPDNSRFVFVTARWSEHGRYDLAIYDTLTRVTRHLTGGDDTDEYPKWSPDGSRIAFNRTDVRTGVRGLCVIDADGANLRCIPAGATSGTAVLAWADAHRVYLRQDTASMIRLERFDVDADSVDFVDDRGGNTIISPDGKFAVCQCPRQGYAPTTWIVYPIERPGEFAVLRFAGEDQRKLEFGWAPATPRTPWASRVEIALGLGSPVVGVPHQLSASGIDSAGRPVPLGAVRWRSEDTSVATIDTTGCLTPRRAGRVSIVASAGGWREVHTMLTITEPVARVLFDEDWSGALAPRWRPFGVPRPVLVASASLGRAFLNNGDGLFFSGAYTTSSFETRGGLWLEADVSARITSYDSQDLVIWLFNNARDSAAWSAWDHATGDGPPGISSPAVSVRYPRGAAGKHWGEQIGATLVGTGPIIDVPSTVRTGRPFRFVMQIFPDGRVGLAFDGRAAFVSAVQFLEPSVRVGLAGNSVGTRLLVGHLRVASGVAPSVDWARAPSAVTADR